MAKKNKLTGKFVVVYDTIVDGQQCGMTEDEKGKRIPMLYDNEDEAFREIFDDSLAMLSNYSSAELKEYCGITKKTVVKMKAVSLDDIGAMKKFLEKNPKCNYNDEWVEPAETFIQNRKTIFGSGGLKVTGTKLK